MLHIFTFKDGLLAKLAHDLRLSINAPTIEKTNESVRVTFQVSDVQVDGVMKKGALHAQDLSDSQKAEIKGNITNKIFKNAKEITFEGQLSSDTLKGDLTFNGTTHAIQIATNTKGDQRSGSIDLTPSKWGIQPYKAMAGAIKLKDKWRIEFTVPQQ